MNKYQESIEVIDTLLHLMCGEEREDGYEPTMEEMSESMDLLKDLANKAESFEWIPFEIEDGFLYCQIPDDDGYVLDSGYELCKCLAWMPLPKPYKEKENER